MAWPVLGLLAACGGGGSDGNGARSGVSVDSPVQVSSLAVSPSEAVAYQAHCSGRGALVYDWDAGDGHASPAGGDDTLVYRYAEEGVYLPRVTCRDSAGASVVSTAEAYIQVAIPTHTVRAVQVVQAVPGPDTTDVALQARCDGEPGAALDYAWDFGDGAQANGEAVHHLYANGPGGLTQYTATVRCTKTSPVRGLTGRMISSRQTVLGTTTVMAGNTSGTTIFDAVATIRKPLTLDPPVPTTAGPTSFAMDCGLGNYAFDFGDGSAVETISGPFGRVSHTYAQNGEKRAVQYTVRASCTPVDGRNLSVGRGQSQSLQVQVRVPAISLLAGDTASKRYLDRLALDAQGNLYVWDLANHVLLKRTPAGELVVHAGNGTAGYADGPAASASFGRPEGLAVGPDGSIYVADYDNHAVRKIAPDGRVSTLAGRGSAGYADGKGSAARFNRPSGVTVGPGGEVYVADTFNFSIRRIGPDGEVTTLAGAVGQAGSLDGAGSAARFDLPGDVAVDPAGNVYVMDKNNHSIRKISPSGQVTTLAVLGGRPGGIDLYDVGNFQPSSLALDRAGNVHVADRQTGQVIRVAPTGAITVLSTGFGGMPGSGQVTGIAVRADGVALVVDPLNDAIRTVAPDGSTATLFRESGESLDGSGAAARFQWFGGMAVDGRNGDTYVSDGHAVRRVTTAGEVTTWAGTGVSGNLDGPALQAKFNAPSGIAVGAGGEVYVADTLNHSIRKIALDGTVSTLAGSQTAGFLDGQGALTRFNRPTGLVIGPDGNLYVTETLNRTIRKVTPGGAVSTLIGGPTSTAFFNNAATLGNLSLDGAGNFYFIDRGNDRVRIVSAGGTQVDTLKFRDGNGALVEYAPQDKDVAADDTGNVYIANRGGKVLKISTEHVLSELDVPIATDIHDGFFTGIVVSGRRLVLGGDRYLAQLDFAP